MKTENLLRAILPDVLIDNFEVVDYEKTEARFDIWLDEKKVLLREDVEEGNVISHGFSDYRTIRDLPPATGSTDRHCASNTKTKSAATVHGNNLGMPKNTSFSPATSGRA